ncbi:uncharacterized protein C8A04DRAFT_35845 [Dichotomopilus funicola]|uniref:non-specific serine/threonine protein kinase n=1 Tax=Dichotomopilus funicola TaxID=1934379 RepID=A0AAN6V5N1_9PEZI|nr:hypothetical protein C8A04DRAFT_35845 [Dichotomopilus funicola]
MDRRSSSQRPASRKPLGDAAQRLNYTAASRANRRQHRAGDVENHILVEPKSRQHGSSNPTITVNNPAAEDYSQRDPARAPASAVPAVPVPVDSRLIPAPQDTRGEPDTRRVSQFSNVSSTASSTRQLKTHIGPWQLGKTLGKGSSARVRLARHRVSHQLVAIKIVAKSTAYMTQAGSLANLDNIDYKNLNTVADGGLRRMPLAIEREVAILKLIRHPNIIELLDIWENRSEIYMVTEYVEKGDLFEFINWHGPLQEEEAIFYFRQIMTALDYCHSFNICHRDLKPENILLKANGQIKIADFGMAALQQDSTHQLRTACGSPHYAAPELLRHQVYKGSAVDIWSMGVILFAMLAGCLPFDEPNMEAMLAKAKKADYKMPPQLTREAKDLIKRILVAQPTHRIVMKQMWRHALIRKYDYLEQYQAWEGMSETVLSDIRSDRIPDEIDIQILRQLKALWHMYSESALEEKLRQEKPNDQKLFYWLLYSHREAQLENYNNNVPISKSDFHHLKPPNWAKRVSTCQFTKPGKNGHTRTISRFTVISNVPDVDEAGTIRSYDPYNASRVPCGPQASHAKIVIHRSSPNPSVGQSPTSVSHSYRSYRSGYSSLRQRGGPGSRRTGTTGQLSSSLATMSSIRSYQSNPRVRANNRSKRSVDFSSIRSRSYRHRNGHSRRASVASPASLAGDASQIDRATLSSRGPVNEPPTYKVTTTRSMIDIGDTTSDTFFWTEELEQLGHRIARDCDEAFRSSLLLPEPDEVGGRSRETSPLALSLGTLPVVQECPTPGLGAAPRPWDNRPLPPVPSRDTVSPLSIRKAVPGQAEPTSSSARSLQVQSNSSNRSIIGPDRRIVSEPTYDRPRGDARQLPSISENTPGDRQKRCETRRGFVPEPLNTPVRVEHQALDYLARAENTIRVVNSPSALGAHYYPVQVPEPLNVRKASKNNNGAQATAGSSAQNQEGRVNSGSQYQQPDTIANGHDVNTVAPQKRVSSWFRRSSKEHANVPISTAAAGTDDHGNAYHDRRVPSDGGSSLKRPNSRSTDDVSGRHPQKKKSFGFGFWKGSKEEAKMSLADSDPDDMRRNERTKKKNRMSKESRMMSSIWSESDGSIRKIEVQQNWLARLFHIKPAIRYLCFNIFKRRARQEVAILLREWHLNLKEVAFAVELMTVIEHGKRNHLSIARFTQEKGAASSFHRVVDAINSSFGARSLLVTDKRKVNMMIKTLNS